MSPVRHYPTDTSRSPAPRQDGRYLLDHIDKSVLKALVLHRDSLSPKLFVIYTNCPFYGRSATGSQDDMNDSNSINPDTDELLYLAEANGVDVLRIEDGPQHHSRDPRVAWIERQRAPNWIRPDGKEVRGERIPRLVGAHR
ncbi:hypothetical protein ES702_00244 [subsurface metagenome]